MTEPILELDDVSVRFRSGALGAKGITMSIDRGSIVAIFGPNGAGKTTTVRAIGGFLRAEGAKVSSGRVRFKGRDITNWEPHRVSRAGIAYMPERNKIFPQLTVNENLLAIGGLPRGEKRAAAFDRVFEMFPVLAERRRSVSGQLSGGQQQMLALSRAWLSRPEVLIIDEMTLGLHHSLHPVLFDAVSVVSQAGTTVVLVEESTGLALELADYCYLLYGGKLKDHGPVARFYGNELLIAGYLGEGN